MGRARRAPRDEGAAAVEFAIVAPLLFLLLFWTFEFGWELWELQAGQSSAREVARIASIGGLADGRDPFVASAACLVSRNGPNAGQLTGITVVFSLDPGGSRPMAATDLDGYVTVKLTYRSTLAGLLPTPLTASDGSYTSVAVSRLEQLPGSALVSGFLAAVPQSPCA
jgi:Flp pilus assembly protein TadG